ncbi:hypothetical protein [Filifactor villosus]|uniref:hypothetical protein n=1 Tax=Filifactor villosus TaxID=29374 RepID=UPI0036D2C4CF
MFFRCQGQDLPLTKIYERDKKRRGLRRYLLSVDIEVVKDGEVLPSKVCKSFLKLGKECRSLSYEAMTAHTAIVFVRYMMLFLERIQISVFQYVCRIICV